MKTYFSFFFISLITALIVTPWGPQPGDTLRPIGQAEPAKNTPG